MQTPPTNRHSQKPSNPYSPSVPISVYRELAAELQQARDMVDSLKSQNQQLVKQNQQLQQQVEKVVQSAQHLQDIVASFGVGSNAEMPRQSPNIPAEPHFQRPSPNIPAEPHFQRQSSNIPTEPHSPRPSANIPPDPRSSAGSPPPPPPRTASIPEEFAPPLENPEPVPPPYRETVVIEQEDSRSRRSSPSEGFSEVSGWMLLLAILLIVLTAFGTGFLIVKPLLNNNKR